MYPIYAYISILLLYHFAEWIVVVRFGSWRRKPSKGWITLVFNPLIKLVMLLPIIEQMYFGRATGFWGYAVGGVLFVLAAVLRVKGHLDLRQGFTPNVEVLKGQQLVDKGIYRSIRHPMYLAIICLAIACPTFLLAYYSFAYTLILISWLLLRIRAEEVYLAIHMPGYADYIKRTWALLPRIF